MSCELLPPGFRFHPTDEELIIHYLQNQATSRPCPVPIIPELNIYKLDPWELPDKSDMCDGQWYFFSPRDRKYPNGSRPNRSTKSGYWKATGTDKAIYSSSRFVGIKKALVFYKGRPPRGSKTEWIMHEYRLITTGTNNNSCSTNGSMRLDDWVLYRIYHKGNQKKKNSSNSTSTSTSVTNAEQDMTTSTSEYQEKIRIPTPTPTPNPVLPRSCSIAHLLESHDYISASQLFDEAPYCSIDDLFDSSSSTTDAGADFYSADAIKLMGSQSLGIGRSVFLDPIFQH